MAHEDVGTQVRDLTDLQIQCLEGFWNRKTAKRIASELKISEAWVNKNLLGARKQLNVNSSAEAAAIVFGSKPGGTKNYYYQKTGVPRLALAVDEALALRDGPPSPMVAREQALLNRFGPLATIVGIVVVSLSAIIGVSLLIGVAQGLNQIWKALGN